MTRTIGARLEHIIGAAHGTPELKLALEAKSSGSATDYYVFNIKAFYND